MALQAATASAKAARAAPSRSPEGAAQSPPTACDSAVVAAWKRW